MNLIDRAIVSADFNTVPMEKRDYKGPVHRANSKVVAKAFAEHSDPKGESTPDKARLPDATASIGSEIAANGVADAVARYQSVGSSYDGVRRLTAALVGRETPDKVAIDLVKRLLPGLSDLPSRAFSVPVATNDSPEALREAATAAGTQSALPPQAAAAYVAGPEGGEGSILISASLNGKWLAQAAEEEVGQALARRARIAGADVAEGGVGARLLQALDGVFLNPQNDPSAFDTKPVDGGDVLFQGRLTRGQFQPRSLAIQSLLAAQNQNATYTFELPIVSTDQQETIVRTIANELQGGRLPLARDLPSFNDVYTDVPGNVPTVELRPVAKDLGWADMVFTPQPITTAFVNVLAAGGFLREGFEARAGLVNENGGGLRVEDISNVLSSFAEQEVTLFGPTTTQVVDVGLRAAMGNSIEGRWRVGDIRIMPLLGPNADQFPDATNIPLRSEQINVDGETFDLVATGFLPLQPSGQTGYAYTFGVYGNANNVRLIRAALANETPRFDPMTEQQANTLEALEERGLSQRNARYWRQLGAQLAMGALVLGIAVAASKKSG